MRVAYGLLGLTFVIVLMGAGVLFSRHTNTPEVDEQASEAPTSHRNNVLEKNTMENELSLTSLAFDHNGIMPQKYTCDGEEVNPPFLIEGVPGAAASLTLIVDDPDAPGDTWNHWIIFNIPPNTSKIEEDSVPEGVGGLNSWGKTGYGGPCPHNGEHHYHFRLYALDSDLPLAVGATKVQVEQAMKGHVVAQTELIGRYKRQ